MNLRLLCLLILQRKVLSVSAFLFSKYFNPYKFSEESVDEVKEEENDKDSLLNEFGEVNLPKVINKVRDFVNSLSDVSNLIETSEVDLTDKYQIVIEIDKNTPM